MVVTRQDVLILEHPMKLVQFFPLHALTCISTSPYNDGCFVLHVHLQTESHKNRLGCKGDAIFVSDKVIEFTAITL
ncbi:hypothetical protein, partial [Salmonella sp. s54836]|uniref:hypothetical protein n=1 Tax=Salmonella sp. s54836 TaxID=3159673 RepID=UPI0039814397